MAIVELVLPGVGNYEYRFSIRAIALPPTCSIVSYQLSAIGRRQETEFASYLLPITHYPLPI
ncbi:hypothetical protein [Chroococcidiopsis sp. SAG 2025]|uniref:hypothetical protein n=1 Tax=Chroococcidiopsis sp. SAG 2025 TaxID=171389 RepID=UPI002936F4E9|nr:hypothetical protein [Chroococcidiopsis sp. SAG 2025]